MSGNNPDDRERRPTPLCCCCNITYFRKHPVYISFMVSLLSLYDVVGDIYFLTSFGSLVIYSPFYLSYGRPAIGM